TCTRWMRSIWAARSSNSTRLNQNNAYLSREEFMKLARTILWAVPALALVSAFALGPTGAQTQGTPRFDADPSWPKDLPEKWIVGQLGGVCSDPQDNIYVTNRRDITAEEKETSTAAPAIMKFDPSGNVIAHWGEPNVVPGGLHGCTIDRQGNMW